MISVTASKAARRESQRSTAVKNCGGSAEAIFTPYFTKAESTGLGAGGLLHIVEQHGAYNSGRKPGGKGARRFGSGQ